MFRLRQGLRSMAAGVALIGAPLTVQAEEEIVLGAAISLTGKYAANGLHTKNGYDFAVSKINSAGGVEVNGAKHLLRILYYNDESSPALGAELAERLIVQDGVQFMLGPYSSGLTEAIAPVTEKHRIPMIVAQGASRSLFNKGYRYMFAVLTTSEQYLAPAIDLAAEMAKKQDRDPSDMRVAMAFENDTFSQDVRTGVLADLERHGMQVVIDDTLPPELDDMSKTLAKVKTLRPDVLLISGHSRGAATAVRQISEAGVSVPIIALTHCEAADITGKFGEGANGLLCPTQWAETLRYSDPVFGTAAEFEAEFRVAFPEYADRPVPYQAAQASAAVLIFKDAFERAGTLDRDVVRDAIAATRLKTFYGRIEFAEQGNNIAKPMVLRQIQAGAYKIVAPSEFASAEVEFPRP